MFDKFCDYMYYLLTSPFKRAKKKVNQWHVLFRVLGRRFDDALESLYKAGEQTMLATCEPEMIPVHAEDRGMERHGGESMENFRARIAMYWEVCRLGGTDAGILLAARTLGYGDVGIKTARKLKADDGRWAEFYIIIRMEAGQAFPVPFPALQREVRNWKEVGAKDNYQFIIGNTGRTNEICGRCRAVAGMAAGLPEDAGICAGILIGVKNTAGASLTVHIRNDLWHLDGSHRLDGKQLLDAYERVEEMA